MPTITVDSTTQRYTSAAQPEPDVHLLHTTEGMSWPGYSGGGEAPHDTIKPLRGVGINVRRHYPYDQYSKSLQDQSGGVQTNKRGVIQTELMGTCDPQHRNDPAWYYWPDADDAVLQALADYYRPIYAQYAIPHAAMGTFVAYPASYGYNAAQRLTPAQWTTRQGICGHQHAPENCHGDPGNFPIARFIGFLNNTAPQGDDMPTMDELAPMVRLQTLGALADTAVAATPAARQARDAIRAIVRGELGAVVAAADVDETKLAQALAPIVVGLLPATSGVTVETLAAALRDVLRTGTGTTP